MTKDILSGLKPVPGSRKARKRIGRGQGSGRGGTATRGHKGQHSRAGSGRPAWFEGGQMPLVRRVPKRGFHSPFKRTYQVVSLERLNTLAAAGRLQDGVVTPELLQKFEVVKKRVVPVKILGNGTLSAKLEVSAHAFSKSAIQKIEAAGGKAQIIIATQKE